MPKLVSCVVIISYWNSRGCHPREGGDLAATSGDFLCVISILTPARGVTNDPADKIRIKADFNSHPREGGDPSMRER